MTPEDWLAGMDDPDLEENLGSLDARAEQALALEYWCGDLPDFAYFMQPVDGGENGEEN
jgi:hypothetical protein